MSRPVKTRPYRSPQRAAQAAATRVAVLRAAHQLFTAQGYAGTTVTQVARTAGVAVDTVYAAVGRKPQLILALVDEALAGHQPEQPQAVPTSAQERDYVRAVREAQGARAKLATYARAIASRHQQVVPLVAALRQAAGTDPTAAQALAAFGQRRADNMRLFAADLRETGELRTDLTDDQVADFIWSTNATEYYELLTTRGLGVADIERLLTDIWTRVLLAP
ncbi:TetR/AcrR family transcriptional regulator [Angustibacter sp. McL0619]|uniref:TetR/AcrR family transcriptional regulator n=1 Tax=Angustibacter sp. McL0619 TaxID=3415676 RepID=UPI003CF0C499